MGSNYHTSWDTSTKFKPSLMDPPLAALDKAATYNRFPIVTCDGTISWDGATLTWDDTIRIYFCREDGQAILNTIAAGSQAIAAGSFVYVTLNETNNTVLTTSTAAITTGAASNFLSLAILVLGHRNATNDDFYPVHLQILPEEVTLPTEYYLPTMYYPAKPGDSAIILRIPILLETTFVADFVGSLASVDPAYAATAETVLTIKKNGTDVGTITFAAAGSTGVFDSSATPVVYSAGDYLIVVNQATADATLAGIGIGFKGTR